MSVPLVEEKMRQVRNIPEIQLALNELFDFKDRTETSIPNLHGRRITNVGEGKDLSDVVVVSQLPSFINKSNKLNQNYTIVFDKSGQLEDTDEWADYIVGKDKTGIITEVMLKARIGPTTDDLIMNLFLNEVEFLSEDIVIEQDSEEDDLFVKSYKFTSPVRKCGLYSSIRPKIITAGAASYVSMLVTVTKD